MVERPKDNRAATEQALGRFLVSFSCLEREVGEAVKIVLSAKEPADLIVAALGDFARKVNTVKAAIKHAQGVDRKPASEEWKKSTLKTMNACLKINEEWRVLLAHASMEIEESGDLKMRSLTITGGKFEPKEETKTAAELQAAADNIDVLIERIRTSGKELTTLVFSTTGGQYLFTGGSQGIPLTLLSELMARKEEY